MTASWNDFDRISTSSGAQIEKNNKRKIHHHWWNYSQLATPGNESLLSFPESRKEEVGRYKRLGLCSIS